ncbi:hypothetical protein N0V90_011433 [Kalmusia sp. IMI 367209]|nr:hypothetical protein N0V90_011433 [Kalmusia sp. IMI 367209]
MQNRYRNPYLRYSSRTAFDYGRGYGGYTSQYPSTPRGYVPFSYQQRPYGRHSYYEDEDYLSEDDYDESDIEDSYYPSQYRRRRSYTDWEDEEDDMWDEDVYDEMDEDDEDEFDDYGYNSDAYGYGRRGGYGYHRGRY